MEPAEARRAITPVGNRVTEDVLIARNMTIALVAVPLCGFSRSSSCIARMPKGVAALPSPSTLAGNVQDHGPHCRVVGRDIGKQAHHQGPHSPRDDGEQAAGLRHLHQPQKQGHDPDQPDGQFDRALGGGLSSPGPVHPSAHWFRRREFQLPDGNPRQRKRSGRRQGKRHSWAKSVQEARDSSIPDSPGFTIAGETRSKRNLTPSARGCENAMLRAKKINSKGMTHERSA